MEEIEGWGVGVRGNNTARGGENINIVVNDCGKQALQDHRIPTEPGRRRSGLGRMNSFTHQHLVHEIQAAVGR